MYYPEIVAINKIIDALEFGKEHGLVTELTPGDTSRLLWYIKVLETEIGIREEKENQ
jgi:hypothetical protein